MQHMQSTGESIRSWPSRFISHPSEGVKSKKKRSKSSSAWWVSYMEKYSGEEGSSPTFECLHLARLLTLVVSVVLLLWGLK